MPPQVNATLTKVAGATGGESYDGPPAAGPQKWAGEEDVYLRERRQRIVNAQGGVDIVLDRVLMVDRDVDPGWAVGDVVTFTRRDGGVETGVVELVERPDISDPDIPAELITTRLTLQRT